MPITPLHYPLAYLIHKYDRKLSFPGLIIGCMQPDLEIPILYLLTHDRLHSRLVLHSLIGASTIGVILSFIIVAFMYPKIVNYITKLETNTVETKCTISINLLFSCTVGNLSHVLLDVTNHEYNPLLWPFLPAEQTFNPVSPLLGGYINANIIVHLIMLSGLIFIIISENRQHGFLTDQFWKEILVG